MQETIKATAAGETPAAANTNETVTIPTATAEIAPVAAKETVKLFKLKIPGLKKTAKEIKAIKEAAKRVTGDTVHVATTNYKNWHRSEPYEVDGVWYTNWCVSDFINGSDESVRDVARFIKFSKEESAVAGSASLGYISVTPSEVANVVAKLNKWIHDNHFNEDGTPIPEDDQLLEQFTVLENFIDTPAKIRAPRKTKSVVVETAPVVETNTPVLDEVTA